MPLGSLTLTSPPCRLARCWVPGRRLVDLVENDTIANATANMKIGAAGPCLAYAASETTDSPAAFYPSTGNFTALAVLETNSVATTQAAWYESDGTTVTAYNGFGGGAGSTIREIHFGVLSSAWVAVVQRTTATAGAVVSMGTPVANQAAAVVMRVNGNTLTGYSPGATATLTDAGVGGTLARTTVRVAEVGDATAGRYWRGNLYLFASWREDVGDAYARELVNNPWQIFQPLSARIYSFPTAAPGGAVGPLVGGHLIHKGILNGRLVA